MNELQIARRRREYPEYDFMYVTENINVATTISKLAQLTAFINLHRVLFLFWS